MAADATAAAIKSAFFHPQHLLTRYREAPSYPCAACERVVTGTLYYRCDECNFNIHEACLLTLPESISFDQHTKKDHMLTLTHLGASRCCDVCKVTSAVGSYMYQCAQCDFDVHPRCTPLLAPADATPQPRQPSRTRRFIRVGLKIGMVVGLHAADMTVASGIMWPVLAAISQAIDKCVEVVPQRQ
jgi:hypothetical protein